MLLPRAFLHVRLQIDKALTGIAPGQNEIEIVTGMGGGDCGYEFHAGEQYIVYAHRQTDQRLETSICSRTRPLAQAAEDLEYFEGRAGSDTSELRVYTSVPGVPARSDMTIVVEGDGVRYTAQTNSAGEALFQNMPAGEYRIHNASDGDLPDDPKLQLYAKGCGSVTLLRKLRITGRVFTKSGKPASRIEIQIRPVQDGLWDSRMTGPDGSYELQLIRPGAYYLGVNLTHSPTMETPFRRWFYPGTADEAAAEIIHFSGTAQTQNYDLTLPDSQNERAISGIVLTADGLPKPRADVSVLDSAANFISQAIADPDGRFHLRLYEDVAYQIHAVWPGNTPDTAVSAVPLEIQPGRGPIELRLVLTEHGNSYLELMRKRP